MSTVITYRTDKFNIMVCDTRKIYFSNGGAQKVDDSALKMHYIVDFGFVSGIGTGELIKDFFNIIKSHPCCRNSLDDAFYCAYNQNANNCNKAALESLDKTGVIVSTKREIVHISKILPYPQSLIPCTVHIDYPPDIDESIKRELNGSGKELKSESPFAALVPILQFFQEIAHYSEYVSSTASISILGSYDKDPFFAQGEVDALLLKLKQDSKPFIESSFLERRIDLENWDEM